MSNFTDVPSPDVGTQQDGHPAGPHISRRISVYEDLDELTKPRQLDNQEQWHSPIVFECFKEHSEAENSPVYSEVRCPDCATEAKDRDDKDQTVRLQRTLTRIRQVHRPLMQERQAQHRKSPSFTHPFPKKNIKLIAFNARCLTLARKSNSGENGFQLAGTSSSPVFDPKVAKQGNLSDVAELIGKNSDNSLFRRTVDVECHQAANNLAPFARESALIENMISEYASLFNSDFDSGLVDMRYERPRAVPVVPKRDFPDSMKQQSNISTGALTNPKPVSRNFRRLRLDIQHSNRSIYNTQSDQESPDWACRTSLAIESGTISMDSLYRHRRDSTPRHISEAMGSPIKIFLRERKTVQSFGPGGVEATYSAPPNKHRLAHAAADRHSEHALQLVRGENAARLVGKLEGMKVKTEEEPLRLDSVQVASPIDLNKSLPALPLQVCGQNGKK
ncbi:hypothetical protein A1F96_10585 [Pyrenophora tritici-repentis]|nr:hypothetical protein A1F96_10585 [Pyrenophora tritici-repentis]